MVITRATMLEWPQIELLRASYYAAHPRLPWEMPSSENAEWWCVRVGTTVVGACAWEDGAGGVRWITDFWIADLGRVQRVKVAIMMRDCILKAAAADGRSLAAMCQSENEAQIRFILRRSKAVPSSVVLFQQYEGAG